MYNLDLMNWRLTTGAADSIPANVAQYLDLVSSLCGDDVSYYRFALPHCDVFDIVNQLDWINDRGLVTEGDRKLHDTARATILGTRNVYMTAAEVEARVKHADGHCPFCGFSVSFSSEADSRGFFHCISRCSHFRFDNVQGIEACLRRPKTWAGKRWPYSWDRLIAREDGTPLIDEISHHCSDCRTADAHRVYRTKVAGVLREMAEKALTPGWFQPGWSNACSALNCRNCHGDCGRENLCCQRMDARIDDWAQSIVEDKNGEFRLNGAGLKLYTRGIHVGFMRGEISFNMRVGGDQDAHYAQFVAWANARLAELKLTDDSRNAA